MTATHLLQAGEIETLADSLSACADQLHERIMKAIRRNPPGGPPPQTQGKLEAGIAHGAAQALFENEVALRQRANSLYVNAALLAAAGLAAPQQELLGLAVQARYKIARINVLKDLIELTAGLLALAAALAAGKPEQLPAAIGSIKDHVAQLKTDRRAKSKPPTPS